jgi:hypothetical protein
VEFLGAPTTFLQPANVEGFTFEHQATESVTSRFLEGLPKPPIASHILACSLQLTDLSSSISHSCSTENCRGSDAWQLVLNWQQAYIPKDLSSPNVLIQTALVARAIGGE